MPRSMGFTLLETLRPLVASSLCIKYATASRLWVSKSHSLDLVSNHYACGIEGWICKEHRKFNVLMPESEWHKMAGAERADIIVQLSSISAIFYIMC